MNFVRIKNILMKFGNSSQFLNKINSLNPFNWFFLSQFLSKLPQLIKFMLILNFHTLLQILEIAKNTISYQFCPLILWFRTNLTLSVEYIFVYFESLGKSDVSKWSVYWTHLFSILLFELMTATEKICTTFTTIHSIKYKFQSE